MKLAILGGQPVRTGPFPKFPVAGGPEVKAFRDFLARGDSWNCGPGMMRGRSGRYDCMRDFEERFAAWHQARHGILVGNGSIALAIALRAVGVEPGDEVIFQPYTCYANVEPVLQVNAVPVFVDIDPQTYCLDVRRIEEKITRRTRAIVAIHWAGRPADMDAIRAIGRRHGLAVIEDCAVAHGAEWRGKKVGPLAAAGAFSFGWGKLMQCGEGGIVLTNNRKLAETADHLRNRGRDLTGDAYLVGWNSRISEILAAILLEQLKRYPGQLARRARNAAYLRSALGGVQGIELLKDDKRITRNAYSYFLFRFKEEEFGIPRQRFLEAMNREGIGVGGPGYPVPCYRYSLFTKGILDRYLGRLRGYQKRRDYRPACYPESERAYRKEAVWLPHNCLLGPRRDMDDIIAAIVKIRENVDQLR